MRKKIEKYVAKKRFIAVILIFIFVFSMGISSYAAPDIKPEEEPKEDLTEEELKEFQEKQLKKIYQIPVQTNEISGWPKGPGTYGNAAIVMDVETGTVLYGKNIDEQHYPASITKVLTALVAMENGKMSDKVKFSHDCVSFLQPGDSSIGMKENDVITLEQALYATLLASANEAAYAVAENVGKNADQDYHWFINQMNVKCRELGGTNSNFVNANGLHDKNHYTSARDMALIGRELFKYPEFFEIVQTPQYEIPASKTSEQHIFQQKHKMLLPNSSEYYKYAVGGKTGFTSDALGTLITMADNGKMQLVCVVLRTHGGKSYPDTKKLLNYAFKNFEKVDVKDKETSEDVGEILEDESGQYSGSVILPKGVDFEELDMEMEEVNDHTGEVILTYSYEGTPVGAAKAKVSDKYAKAHQAKITKEKEPAEKKEVEKRDKTSEKQKTKRQLMVIGLTVFLVILFLLFLIKFRQYRKKLDSRRRRNRR